MRERLGKAAQRAANADSFAVLRRRHMQGDDGSEVKSVATMTTVRKSFVAYLVGVDGHAHEISMCKCCRSKASRIIHVEITIGSLH